MELILKKYKEEIKSDFGVDIEDLRVHSFRKGAASYIRPGLTFGPPQIATNIIAGWTMGQIHDTHLQFEAAGDSILIV